MDAETSGTTPPIPAPQPEGGNGGLTVILPNYNHAKYLPQAISSVLNQTRPPDRLIILDDCSTDTSRDIIRTFAAANSCIRFIPNEQRRGVNPNINAGLAMADTDYVSFQAADDFIEPPLYETALAGLEQNPGCALSVTANQWRNEAGEPLPQPADPPIARAPTHLPAAECFAALSRYGSFIAGTGAVYRTARLRETGFDPALGPFSDAFAQHQMIASGGLFYIPQRLAAWRKLETGYAISTQRNAASAISLFEAIRTALNSPAAAAIPPAYRRILQNRLCFDAVRAILADPNTPALRAAGIIASPLGRAGFTAASLLGRKAALAAAVLVLRPRDIAFATKRRLGGPGNYGPEMQK